MGLFPFDASPEGGVEISLGGFLDDLPPMGVVLGESNHDLVVFQDANDGVTQRGGDVCGDDSTIGESNAVERLGANLYYRAARCLFCHFRLPSFFELSFSLVRTSGPGFDGAL